MDEFERSIKFLSELPTERAMKDLYKMRAPESVKRVVEVMAISKMDLVKSLRLMHIREQSLKKALDAYRNANKAFKDLQDFISKHEDYDITITEK